MAQTQARTLHLDTREWLDRVVVMSARPGRIKAIFDIDIPRPRTLHLKRDPVFLKYLDEVWTLIEEEVRKSGQFMLDEE